MIAVKDFLEKPIQCFTIDRRCQNGHQQMIGDVAGGGGCQSTQSRLKIPANSFTNPLFCCKYRCRANSHVAMIGILRYTGCTRIVN